MKKKSMEATITQVASQAGVSIATVSRVLNTPTKVRPSTVNAVIEAMDALGYPHEEAIPILHNKLLVVVLPNVDNPFYAKIIKGMQAAAKNHGLEILLYPESNVDTHSGKLLRLLRLVNACGLILLSPVSSLEVLDRLSEAVPVVQCAEYNEKSTLPYVSVDDFTAAKNAVENLLRRGRKRIAIMNGPEKYKYARQRLLGYEAALKEAGLPIDPAFITHVTEMGFDSALAVARQMLLNSERPDAILATSDIFAAAVVKTANAEGIQIPAALSLISFDNTYISQMTHPGVAAVNMPQFQLGYMACEALNDRIQNPLSSEPRQYLLKTELVLRDSV
ncbi:MAG: substrate-binding domain-containing protein [Eubacteriales bacterium]|nr:substrate-binding domain-containing protein [Eubacteriales bacterium]